MAQLHDMGDTASDGADASAEDDGDEPEVEPVAECGHGIVESGEACDLGFANADDGLCTAACQLPGCGDGIVGPDEVCDEGPGNGGETCSDACTVPSRLRWSATHSGLDHGWDVGGPVVATADGSVYFAHVIDDGYFTPVLERRAADGDLVWSTELSEEYSGLSLRMEPAPSGDGVLLACYAAQLGVEGTERAELLHIDSEGRTWRLHTISAGQWGVPLTSRLAVAGEQIVFVTALEVGADDYQALIVRLDGSGEVLSERTVDPLLSHVAGRADGGFFAHGSNDLMSFDAQDVQQWSVPAYAIGIVALALDAEERPLMTRVQSSGQHQLLAFDADGQLRWERGLDALEPRAVAVGADGRIFVTGMGRADLTDLPTNTAVALQAFDARGIPRWREQVQGPGHGDDQGSTVAVAADGSIWVSGRVSIPFEEVDVWMGRFEEEPR